MSEEHKVELIPTDPNPPRPLGRRGVNHDPRNFAFRALAAPSVPEGPPRTTPWYRREIYDQQATSSCTIHAEYGGLRTFSNLSSTSWWFQELDTYGERVATYEESKRYDPWPGEDYEGTSSDAPCKLLKARGRIERYQWFFSPEEVDFWLEHHGQVTVGTNWYYCAVEGTRVLTTDLEWLPVEKISPGDQLVGFDGHGGREAKYRRAAVLTNDMLIADAVTVETDRGRISVSADHRFIRSWSLNTNGKPTKGVRQWVRAADLCPGDRLAYLGDPWEVDRSWEAGWLAGFYDGEGSLGRDNLVTCSQKPGPTHELALRLLDAKGFDHGKVVNHRTGVHHWYLRGENAKLRFLGSIRPNRLLAVSGRAWEGHRTYNKGGAGATVQSVTPIGRQPVYAVGTSTKTLITDGYLSHNSMFYPNRSGTIRIVDSQGNAGGHEWNLIYHDVKNRRKRGITSWGRTFGQYGRFWISDEDFARLMAEDGDAHFSKAQRYVKPVVAAA